jgi:hypothetical protein
MARPLPNKGLRRAVLIKKANEVVITLLRLARPPTFGCLDPDQHGGWFRGAEPASKVKGYVEWQMMPTPQIDVGRR